MCIVEVVGFEENEKKKLKKLSDVVVVEGREQEPVTAWCYQPAGIVLRRAV